MSHGDNWYIPPLPGGFINRTSLYATPSSLTEAHLIAAVKLISDVCMYQGRERVKIVSPEQLKRIKEYAALNNVSEDEACMMLCIPYQWM